MHVHTFASIHIHQFIYNTQLQARNMKDEECSHRNAHFQEKLESLKANVARLTSLLEQTLENASCEGSSNQPITFN